MKAHCMLYADRYGKDVMVTSILNKQFGFELEFRSDTSNSRVILSLEELQHLKEEIEGSIKNYNLVMNINKE